jgi:fructose-bisphosphate aldolase, class II
LEENLRIAAGLLEQCARAKVVLEIECGGVGGEEDGLRAEGPRERLYTTTEDLLRVAEVLAFATSSTAGQARLPRRSGMRSPTAW